MAAGNNSAERLDRAIILEKEAHDFYARAAGRIRNELEKNTFQAIAEKHARQAMTLEEHRSSAIAGEPPQIEPPPALHSRFEEVVRTIEESTAPTASDLEELRAAITYSTKIRDIYNHIAKSATDAWEAALYAHAIREEENLTLTLKDTLDYLRSNFEIAGEE